MACQQSLHEMPPEALGGASALRTLPCLVYQTSGYSHDRNVARIEFSMWIHGFCSQRGLHDRSDQHEDARNPGAVGIPAISFVSICHEKRRGNDVPVEHDAHNGHDQVDRHEKRGFHQVVDRIQY